MGTNTAPLRCLLAALALVALGGCSLFGGARVVAPPVGTISVYTVADRLSLDVREGRGGSVVLTDDRNTVQFFAGLDGQAYVNGRRLPAAGSIVRVDGTVYVPESLVETVRGAMRLAPPDPEPEPVPVEVVQPKPPDPATLIGKVRRRGVLVVIDPGHGGRDPGARSVLGHSEKWINLSIGKKLANELEKRGYDVKLTRTKDVYVSLNDRAAAANAARADLFVSVHSDSCGDPRVRGYSIYTCRGATGRSVAVAKALERSMRTSGMPGKGLREANYRVLVRTRCPAVLIECGYLSSRTDASLLNRRDRQDRIADSIADGIDAATKGW